MNASDLYETIALEFPPTNPEDHCWENVHDGRAARVDAISNLLSPHISTPEAFVLIHHLRIAARMPTEEVASFIAGHVLGGEIQISDPEFTSIVAISQNGVATGWRL